MTEVSKLGTVLTAMVTPFDAQGRVNENVAIALMHHLVEHGSDGVVIAGTTGEAATLTDQEQLRLVELAVRELGGRATVIAGVGSNDTRHATELTESATELGADAMLSVTPYYNRPNRRGIVRHFEEVSRATDKPIILYNIPTRTGTDMPNDLLAELSQLDNISAVKQANTANLAQIDGLDLYAGNDEDYLRVLDLEGAGVISVVSHIFGEQMRQMAGRPELRAEIDASLRDAYEALFVTSNPIPIKAALNLLGHDVGGLRLPMVAADEGEAAVVRAMLERHGLLETVGA